ncbi:MULTISPECIES: hypothetical protein [Actinokineospora]|uniref:Uncharacterized protein n=1 Tax=Actinokineospora fastidiosa TaxID=1816 RepID=A0A918LID3_9PSEU|nr:MULTISPECIES: hypothetical protein [Actinokineospora]UVS77946.1 hypothetical protein Actkin_01669 [Actinokineospora sp. UTMC 2448]GGS50923.1 hypothetical protein GCM10010171_52620 [Actinokineospora fastidiosa]
MKRSLIPAVLLVLLTATACGERQAGGTPEIPVGEGSPSLTMPTKPTPTVAPPSGSADPTRPALTSGPSGVVAPPGYTVLPPDQVENKTTPSDLHEDDRVWVSEDGRTLQLFAVAPTPCTPMEAKVVSTDGAKVTLALGPMAQPQGGPEGQACAQVVTPVPVAVSLADALGDRVVVLTTGS